MREEKLSERPLVTFALFAYNQEDFIREAIEGAFSQSYQPLEIILSDDQSNDRTYEIMKEMASSYDGPHKVNVRKSQANTGTLNHVLSVVNESSGALIILAAADDISYTHRCAKIVKEWCNTGAWGLYSKHDLIDSKGEVIKEDTLSSGDTEIKNWFNFRNKFMFIHGATSAYDRRVFDSLSKSKDKIFTEDAVLSTIIHIKNQVITQLNDTLVGYRQHDKSISNAAASGKTYNNIKCFEEKISNIARGYINLCNYVENLRCIDDLETKDKESFLKAVKKTKRFSKIRYKVFGSSAVKRFKLVFRCRELRDFRYLIPRLFGLSLFSIAKSYLLRYKMSVIKK